MAAQFALFQRLPGALTPGGALTPARGITGQERLFQMRNAAHGRSF